jgi:FixJ family two-component response regulator
MALGARQAYGDDQGDLHVHDVMNDVAIIAIVDDDASIRRALLRVVESAGYKGETFASAREFLDWLSLNQAACLVLDVHMAEMNGFELQERLAVPVVYITARDDGPTLMRIENSGAAGHLRRPFDAATVLATIRRAVAEAPERRRGMKAGGIVHDAGVSWDGDFR